tara:strand:- start:1095 stop:1274 length:180 start_codon:yes stop_codon:yes gene_type:complete
MVWWEAALREEIVYSARAPNLRERLRECRTLRLREEVGLHERDGVEVAGDHHGWQRPLV